MPAKKGEVYRCEKCDNVVKVVEGGAGTLVCCGQPMDLQDWVAQIQGPLASPDAGPSSASGEWNK